jgi:hypothetical protein
MTLVGPEFQAVFDLHPGVYQVSGRSYFSNYIFWFVDSVVVLLRAARSDSF